MAIQRKSGQPRGPEVEMGAHLGCLGIRKEATGRSRDGKGERRSTELGGLVGRSHGVWKATESMAAFTLGQMGATAGLEAEE